MLTIEIEYLTGVVRAGNDQSDAPDWPPQPDRLFSALVASWAARGNDAAERQALEWLEAQPAPLVVACIDAAPRSLVPVFVPPNDDNASTIAILPDRRRRQERRFPACIPRDPIVRLVWEVQPATSVLNALSELARYTSYLGHSASLVRCRAVSEAPPTGLSARPARRRVYPGRLAELERAFAAKRRPGPGAEMPPLPSAPAPQPPCGVFGAEWIVFRHEGGVVPDTAAAIVAAKTLLKAVQAGYGAGATPSWVSGHAPDGTPLTVPHLACVPLLDAGWRWSAGGLMGLALAMPRTLEEGAARATDPDAAMTAPSDADALTELDGLFGALARQGEGALPVLKLGLPGGLCWTVAHDPAPAAPSLKPRRYTETARIWGTVTPLALDRHPRAEAEAEAGIAEACLRIGLPRPRRVVPGKHSAFSGALPAWRGHGSPPWASWRLPGFLAGRRLTHAVLEFDEAVAGPVMLGAGRFCGLGLCLPLEMNAAR